jgi:hypothetical protein
MSTTQSCTSCQRAVHDVFILGAHDVFILFFEGREISAFPKLRQEGAALGQW